MADDSGPNPAVILVLAFCMCTVLVCGMYHNDVAVVHRKESALVQDLQYRMEVLASENHMMRVWHEGNLTSLNTSFFQEKQAALAANHEHHVKEINNMTHFYRRQHDNMTRYVLKTWQKSQKIVTFANDFIKSIELETQNQQELLKNKTQQFCNLLMKERLLEKTKLDLQNTFVNAKSNVVYMCRLISEIGKRSVKLKTQAHFARKNINTIQESLVSSHETPRKRVFTVHSNLHASGKTTRKNSEHTHGGDLSKFNQVLTTLYDYAAGAFPWIVMPIGVFGIYGFAKSSILSKIFKSTGRKDKKRFLPVDRSR